MPSLRAPSRSRIVSAALATGTLLGAGWAMAACDDDGSAGDTAAFCTEVAAHQETLFNSPVASADDVAEYVGLYRRLGELAPLSIEADWDTMTEVFAAAQDYAPDSTLVTEQDVLAGTYGAEQAALAVRDWLATNCEITITVATVAPPSLNVAADTEPAPSG